MSVNIDHSVSTLHKPNPDIGFRVASGRLSFVGRKIYNALIYRAQKLGLHGKGQIPFPVSYPIRDLINVDVYWWIPLDDLITDASSGRNSHNKIKSYMLDLMSVLVERNVVGWECHHVIQSMRIINTAHEKANKKGGRLILGWNFPQEIEEKILAPDAYTSLSLYYQGLMRTEASLILYEVCKRYSFPEGVTCCLDWKEWQSRMSSEPIDIDEENSWRSEYKYFKRGVLSKAIHEINQHTDISVTLEEFKSGKSVEKIQFRVQIKQQKILPFDYPQTPIINAALLVDLEKIGFSPAAVEKLFSKYGEEALYKTLNFVRSRIENKELPTIKSLPAFFKHAIDNDYAKAAEQQKIEQAKALTSAIETTNKRNQIANDELLKQIKLAPIPTDPEICSIKWSEFRASNAALVFGKIASSFSDAPKLQQTRFLAWLAEMDEPLS